MKRRTNPADEHPRRRPPPEEKAEKLPPEVTEDSPGAGLLGITDDIPEPNEPG